jgi:hypothetical protein
MDPYRTKLTFPRIFSGTLNNDTQIHWGLVIEQLWLDNETPKVKFVIGPYPLSSRIRYRTVPGNELYTKQMLGPIMSKDPKNETLYSLSSQGPAR